MKKSEVKSIINDMIGEGDEFPKIEEIAERLNVKRHQVGTILKILVEDGFLIRTKNNWYQIKKQEEPAQPVHKMHGVIGVSSGSETPRESLPETIPAPAEEIPQIHFAPVIEEKAESIESVTAPEKDTAPVSSIAFYKEKGLSFLKRTFQKQKTIIASHENKIAIYLIRWVMLLVGMGSIAISIYYNTELAREFLPLPLAVICGVIFVLFSVIAFETILLFSKYHHWSFFKRYFIMSAFFSLWIIAAVYSVSATVNGRYIKYMYNQQQKSASHRNVNAGRLIWDNLQQRKKFITERLTEKRPMISPMYAEMKLKISSGENEGGIRWRIGQAEKEIDKLETELESIRSQETIALKNNPEYTAADSIAGQYTDFYDWLSTIFHKPKDKIHFFLSLFPAFFFDVISPIAIAVFMFLRREE